jgi:SAM-dependent methyltransferase
MATPSIDPHRFRDEQRSNWDGISTGWGNAIAIFERGASAMTERLLELGGVRPGQFVLDVGTGHGEPALSAVTRVGPAGRVVGVDLSPAMVEAARRRAAGVANVEFMEADAESIDLPPGSFDVVLSRWGLMFVLDQVAVFTGLRRLLAPGGVLAASVWGPPSSAPMLCSGYAVLAERLELPEPPPGMPGPFSMSDPGKLTATLVAAGFTDVSVTEFVVPFRLDDTWEYAVFNRSVVPPVLLGMLKDRFGSEDDPDTWKAVAATVEPYASDDGGFSLPSTALCIRAVA